MKPLISCICITKNRRIFLRQAINYFFRAQHYSQIECELIIIDGSERINKEIALDAASEWDDVHYFHFPTVGCSRLGEQHNRACELTGGEIILKWDDDDWQSINRIDKQFKALNGIDGFTEALTFTSQYYGYHLVEKQAFRSRCWNTPQSGSMGGALAFHRKIWEAIPFREVEKGVDTYFFDDCVKKKIELIDITDPTYYVYIRHNQNVSADSNRLYYPNDKESVTQIMGKDIDFYDELSEILPLSQRASPATFGQHGLYNRQQIQAYNRPLPETQITLANEPNELHKSIDKK